MAKRLIAWILRLRPRPAAPTRQPAAPTRPRGMGLPPLRTWQMGELGWPRQEPELLVRPPHLMRYRLAPEHVAFTHGIDHSLGILSRMDRRKQTWTAREILAWPSVQPSEARTGAGGVDWGLNTPN